MAIWEIPTLLAISVLGGMKSTYGIELWKDRERPFSQIWTEKWMYKLAGCWLIFYVLVWLLFEKSIIAVRTADLLGTYGILAVIDGKCRIVPDWILICYFAGQMLLGALCNLPVDLLQTCLMGIGFGIICMIFAWFSKGKMGMGDAKLLGITAMTAGCKYTMQILSIALMLSFFYSLYLLGFWKKCIRTEFPFVPFLAVGMAVHLIFCAIS